MRLTLLAVFAAAQLAAQNGTYVLKASRLFDSTAGKLVEPGLVVVSNGRIQSVGPAATPSGAQVVDLGDATLLPGFIDAHTHVTDDFDPDYSGARLRNLQRTIPEKAIRGTADARHVDGRLHNRP